MQGSDHHQKQRKKNIAMFLVLFALISVLYAITLMRMGFSFS
jgi:predicted nucleic acid-binding Zn ribbon protein